MPRAPGLTPAQAQRWAELVGRGQMDATSAYVTILGAAGVSLSRSQAKSRAARLRVVMQDTIAKARAARRGQGSDGCGDGDIEMMSPGDVVAGMAEAVATLSRCEDVVAARSGDVQSLLQVRRVLAVVAGRQDRLPPSPQGPDLTPDGAVVINFAPCSCRQL